MVCVINFNKYCQIYLHRNANLYFSTLFRWFDLCQFEMWKMESHYNFNLKFSFSGSCSLLSWLIFCWVVDLLLWFVRVFFILGKIALFGKCIVNIFSTLYFYLFASLYSVISFAMHMFFFIFFQSFLSVTSLLFCF